MKSVTDQKLSDKTLTTQNGVPLLPEQLGEVTDIKVDGSSEDYELDGVNVEVDADDDQEITWSGEYKSILDLYSEGEHTQEIAWQHQERPKYIATVNGTLKPAEELCSSYGGFIDEFDLDKAVGDQLDIIGEWIGTDRRVKVKMDKDFFRWDDWGNGDVTGWDHGKWKGRYEEVKSVYEVMSDEEYRRILKAKAVANNWDGTMEGFYAIWEIFEGAKVSVIDNQDMSFEFRIHKGFTDLEAKAIKNLKVPIKPSGVRLSGIRIIGKELIEFDDESIWDTGRGVLEATKLY